MARIHTRRSSRGPHDGPAAGGRSVARQSPPVLSQGACCSDRDPAGECGTVVVVWIGLTGLLCFACLYFVFCIDAVLLYLN